MVRPLCSGMIDVWFYSKERASDDGGTSKIEGAFEMWVPFFGWQCVVVSFHLRNALFVVKGVFIVVSRPALSLSNLCSESARTVQLRGVGSADLRGNSLQM